MSWFPPSLAVGGPGPVLGQGWDAAPILLMVTLVVMMRWARVRLSFVSLLGAVFGGLLVDLVTDALHVSLMTTICVMYLLLAMVALQRTRAP
jgi:uncharacterized transporter YbjL